MRNYVVVLTNKAKNDLNNIENIAFEDDEIQEILKDELRETVWEKFEHLLIPNKMVLFSVVEVKEFYGESDEAEEFEAVLSFKILFPVLKNIQQIFEIFSQNNEIEDPELFVDHGGRHIIGFWFTPWA